MAKTLCFLPTACRNLARYVVPTSRDYTWPKNFGNRLKSVSTAITQIVDGVLWETY